MNKSTRYHPLLVIIHWTSALLVGMLLLVGMFSLKYMPNNEEKIPFLAIHMVSGIMILLLTIIRVVVRFSTRLPASARSGNMFLDVLGNLTHSLLYMGMLAMGLSGLGSASQAGLMEIVFGGSKSPLPVDFFIFPARVGHWLTGLALSGLVLLHLAGVAYHQFWKKDGLISRMSIRKDQKELTK